MAQELSDDEVFGASELSDAEVFGEASDADVFGASQKAPSSQSVGLRDIARAAPFLAKTALTPALQDAATRTTKGLVDTSTELVKSIAKPVGQGLVTWNNLVNEIASELAQEVGLAPKTKGAVQIGSDGREELVNVPVEPSEIIPPIAVDRPLVQFRPPAGERSSGIQQAIREFPSVTMSGLTTPELLPELLAAAAYPPAAAPLFVPPMSSGAIESFQQALDPSLGEKERTTAALGALANTAFAGAAGRAALPKPAPRSGLGPQDVRRMSQEDAVRAFRENRQRQAAAEAGVRETLPTEGTQTPVDLAIMEARLRGEQVPSQAPVIEPVTRSTRQDIEGGKISFAEPAESRVEARSPFPEPVRAEAPKVEPATASTDRRVRPVIETESGKIYSGESHAAALANAKAMRDRGEITKEEYVEAAMAFVEDSSHKFQTADGRILDRTQAGEHTGLGGKLQSETAKEAGLLIPEEAAKPAEAAKPVETKPSDIANALAAKLDNLKSGVDPKRGDLGTFNVIPKVWDAAIEVAQGILRKGGTVADAIEAAIKHIRTNQKGQWFEREARRELELALSEQPKRKTISREFEHEGKRYEIIARQTDIEGLVRISGIHRVDVENPHGGTGRKDLMGSIGASEIRKAVKSVLSEFPNTKEIEFYRASKEGQRRYVRRSVESFLSESPAAPVQSRVELPASREVVQKTEGAAGVKPTTDLADVYRIFEPKPKEPFQAKKKAANFIEAVRTGVSSKFRPVNKLAEDIAKAYGLSKPKDIAGIMEQLKGSQGKAEAEIYRFDRDVSNLVKGSEKDFNAYLFLRRAIDRLEMDARDIARAMEGNETIPLNRRAVAGFTLNSLRPKLEALEAKLGPEKLAEFQKAADQYQKHLDAALRLQVESGRMSPEVYDAIKEGNQFYAPFKVMKYLEETVKPEGTGAKIDTVADFTKAMKGIEDADFRLGDMLAAGRQSILLSRILADKNMAMRHVAELSAFDTRGEFIRKLQSGQDVPIGMEAVNVLENGRKVRYAVNPAVAEALQLYGGTGGGIISRMLSSFSVPFRAGATMFNLPFQVSNLLADVPRQALVSKYGLRQVQDLVRYPMDFVHSVLSSIAGDVFRRDNKLFQDFLDSGVAGTTIQEYLTPEALKFREPTSISKSRKAASDVLNVIPRFAKAIEQTSKVLGVKRAMRFEKFIDAETGQLTSAKSGAELAKMVPEAITEIRRYSGSPDFGRQGKWVEGARLNLLYMFLNARIQGLVADVGRLSGRTGYRPAATTWFRLGVFVGIPTVYLYNLNRSAEFREDYEKRSQQEKDNYWLIPKDTFITNEDGERLRDYWRIPKRESAKWIANLTESALDFAREKNPEAAMDFGNSMLQELSPVNISGDTATEKLESAASGLNPLLKAPLELATGRDLYRHRDVMSDQMRKASPEQQYTDRTAQLFRKAAELMPDVAPEFLRSPIILENLTRNLTAGLLTQFLPRKPIEGRTGIENFPLLQRFQALPYSNQEEFKDQMKAMEREAADIQLERHRRAAKLLEDGKNAPLPDIIKNAGLKLDQNGKVSKEDERMVNHLVDLWVAKQNGATYQDRRLLALPARQRADYVLKQLEGKTPEERQQLILHLTRTRVLTEAVLEEMTQSIEQP